MRRVVTPKVLSSQTSTKSSPESLQVATKNLLELVKRDKGISSLEDWYTITKEDLASYQGSRLLRNYHSLSAALVTAYPQEQWVTWKFSDGPPRGFFHSKENQKQFLDWFSKKHNITNLDDWYQFKHKHIVHDGGSALLSQYHGSIIRVLKTFFPDHNWLEWNFSSTTQSYWKNKENRKAFFDWLATKLGYTKPEDWYNLTYQEVKKHNGRSIIDHYYESVPAAVKDLYPELDLKPWLFRVLPHGIIESGYWESAQHRKYFMDWAASQLNITKLDDWYRINSLDLYPLGGKSLVYRFRGSLRNLLLDTYPDFNWIPWKFNVIPDGFWNEDQNVYAFFKYLNELYDIQPNDIFSLTAQNVASAGGSALLKKHKGLGNILKKYLPHLQPPVLDREGMSKGQYRLQRVAESLFPGKQVLPNHRIADNAEVDVFVPEANLALEYQGEYHYQWDYIIGSTEDVQNRDQRKRELCEQLKIHLIEIPFWWDRQKLSVAATIRDKLPDLHMAIEIPPSAKPISSVIPKSVAKQSTKQQMKAMDAGPLQSFGFWNANQAAVGRLLVVAPAGQRCQWDGQKFVDYLNQPLDVPESFRKGLPSDCMIEFVLHTSPEGPTLTAMDINSPLRNYTARIHELQRILPSHINIVNPVVCTEEEQYHHIKNQCITDGKLLLLLHPSSEKALRSLSAFVDPQTLNVLDDSGKAGWVEHATEILPYSLHVGPKSKCHSCQKEFQREDIRLLAHGAFVAMDGRPYRVKYSLCADRECISKAVNKSNARIVFPPFDNRIAVPKHLKDRGIEQKLDQFKDVQLVFQE